MRDVKHHNLKYINPTIDNLCVRIRVIQLWTLSNYGNSPLPYSIEMVWLDEDTIFDKEVKQVLGKSCVEILDPLLLKGDLSDTPTLLLNLIDKIFLFIVEVQISDNPHFSPSYKVKKITDNVDLINKFKEAHRIQIGGKIHASVKKAFVSRFVNLLEEGISYQIRYFGVGLNKGYFKTTHHEYVVNLNQRTDVHRLPESKIMECALLGNYVHELNTFLGSDCKDGAVVVLQFVRVKLFNEKIVLQNFIYGIKIFFNLEDTTVIQFKNRFEESRGNIGRISNEAAFLKIYQGKTIEQLKEFDTTGGTANVNATGPHMLLQKLSNVKVVAVSFYL
ncbi:uncharacterized protein LOC127745603 [Arachis duranensis]|uniref:Uncharacterized protein LOC127745603 n=1 Tax=Arachis duranensis TaxID=130453 RepID=A0A9C6WRK7_ARADU|nr:uncharacterized protein LOC127745603 [Arachis duranensis]